MNILNELKSRFEVAEPIFDYEIYDLGYTDSDIIDTLESNVFEELSGVDFVPCRIFYLVGYSDFTQDYIKLYDNSLSVIEKYFLGNNFEFGYYFGLTLQNKLGLSTQVPSKVLIQSSKTNKFIDTQFAFIVPNNSYTREDLDYICLAEILKFNERPEYDLSKIVKSLELKCTDEAKLMKYM